MGSDALVNDKVGIAIRFVRRFEAFTPVIVAFLSQARDESDWLLTLAIRTNDRDAWIEANREVVRMQRNDFGSLPFAVRLVAPSDEAARAAGDAFAGRPPRVPVPIPAELLGADGEAYLIKGPTGEADMASGREVLNRIIDEEADFFQRHGTAPRRMRLPVLMAYDLAKCGRDELGEISGRVFKDGITVFEREGFHGMSVEILRDRNATLSFE